MFQKKKKEEQSKDIWLEAQSSTPLDMTKLLNELRDRNWVPEDQFEREWFEELCNLCLPLNLEVFNSIGTGSITASLIDSTSFPSHEDKELIPIFEADHNGSDYSLKVLSQDSLLTHSPASAGLVQVWSIPHCQEIYKLKLYSRRSACVLSASGKLLASKSETGGIALDSLPDGKQLRTWEHPEHIKGNSYMIERFVRDEELIVTDRTNAIHFLSIRDNKIRTYPKVLVNQKPLLCSSEDGTLFVTPEYGKRLHTIWKLRNANSEELPYEVREIENDMEKINSLSSDLLPNMHAHFCTDAQYLAVTTTLELQIRKFPYDEIVFQMNLGRDIEQPKLAVNQDSSIMAVLRRSNPPEVIFIDIKKFKVIRTVTLANIFARHPIIHITFAPGGHELLLAGKEKIYALYVNAQSSMNDTLLKLVNIRVRDIKLEDLQVLETAYQSGWMSMYLRPWAEMLFYLVKRRSYDIGISEIDDSSTRSYDIEIA